MNRRTYVRVYDDLTDHPAWEDLDPVHVGLWVLALGYCSRNLTDGHVSLRRLAKLGGTDELVAELVDAGRMHAPGHVCEACPQPEVGRLYVHDYLQHQRSKDDAQALSAVRKAAGQKGGQAKAKQVANQAGGNAKQTPAIDRDIDKENTPALRAESDASFEAWWTEYPRKTAKAAAAKSYAKALKSATAEQLLDGLRNAVQGWTAARTEPQYVPHPATWLNQGRWADEQPMPGMPERDASLRPSVSMAVCDGPCPGGRHDWSSNHGRTAHVCPGVAA